MPYLDGWVCCSCGCCCCLDELCPKNPKPWRDTITLLPPAAHCLFAGKAIAGVIEQWVIAHKRRKVRFCVVIVECSIGFVCNFLYLHAIVSPGKPRLLLLLKKKEEKKEEEKDKDKDKDIMMMMHMEEARRSQVPIILFSSYLVVEICLQFPWISCFLCGDFFCNFLDNVRCCEDSLSFCNL